MLRINPPAGPLRVRGKIIRAAEYGVLTQAEAIIAEAHRQADEIRASGEQAREEEKKRGFAEGLVEAKKRNDQMLLEATIKVVDYLSSAEQSVTKVVLQALEQIVGEMDSHDAVFRIVRLALHGQRGERRVQILVHPTKVKYMTQRLDELRAAHPSIAELHVHSELSLSADGCVIQSELGTIDASLETQLANIRNALQTVPSVTPKLS